MNNNGILFKKEIAYFLLKVQANIITQKSEVWIGEVKFKMTKIITFRLEFLSQDGYLAYFSMKSLHNICFIFSF